jgi:hypothetical protein
LGVYSINFPLTSKDKGQSLQAPANLVATPLEGGTWQIEWDYAFREGDTATGFYLYRQTTAAPFDFTASAYQTIFKAAGVGMTGTAKGPRLKHYVYTETTPEIGTILLAVRSANIAAGVVSDNVNYVTLVPDADAPDAPGGMAGGSA